MENLKRNKTTQRSAFTKAYNKLENILNDANAKHEEIEILFHLFKQKSDALEIIHKNYLDSLKDDAEFEAEFNSVEEYRENSLRIQLKAQRLLDNFKTKLSQNLIRNENNSTDKFETESDKIKTLCQRLPEVELYKFGGDLKDWLTFWNQFKNIHENANLTNVDKFHYLIQSMKIKSESRELVESFPVTNENYSLAVESLTERYGRTDLLIDFYVRELLKLVLNNATKKKIDSLSSLYNKLSTQIRALGSLGVTTEMCGVILYPLVESALPVNILRSFERQRKSIESEQKLSSLDAIILFLKNEVQSEEKIKLSRSEICGFVPERKNLATSQNFKGGNFSAAELISHNSNDVSCVFCLKDHESRFCKKAFFMPLSEKLSIIKSKGLCRICFTKGHLAVCCTRSNIRCQNCSKRHVKFMCPNLDCNKSKEISKSHNDETKEKNVDTLFTHNHNMNKKFSSTNEVSLQTLVVNLKGKCSTRKARIIIDTGSQKSYILRSTAKELGFDFQREEEFSHSLFGGRKTKMLKHKCYKIYLSSLDGNYICNLDALDQDVICNDISAIKYGFWIRELKDKGIRLSDTRESGPIEVLLGADVAGKLFTGRKEQLNCGLVAMETKLGWTLIGKIPQLDSRNDVNMTVVSMLSQEDVPVSALWDLELLGIRDSIEQNSKEDSERAVMIHFEDTVQQKNDGRYEVHLPWKKDHSFLPTNYDLALRRLESTTKKLEKTGYREKYNEIFEEWIHEGVIEEVPENELSLSITHYLPHRPVIKETSSLSSMKVRPVFDASAKMTNFPSLNDCLETGINFIETIPLILTRFRLHEIGVISDIRRAFLQISLHKDDRNFLRFFWYNDDGSIRVLRHTRCVFGVTSSPFLLMAVIHHHLSKELLKGEFSNEILVKLRNSFYVDNCVTSVHNTSELDNFIRTSTEVMKRAKFDLRGWENTIYNNCDTIPQENSETSVLGLIWDKSSDTLKIDTELLNFDESEKLTKRKILSLISRVFDPIGFISPALIQPKLLLQTIWKTKEPWDAELNEDTKRKFLKWFKDLHLLKSIEIPRWSGATEASSLSLHTFVDASQDAYSACIFLRSESPDGTVNVNLLQAKSRITPLKKITIPRLELMAATIGARLFKFIKGALEVEIADEYFWTDSSTVLSWIKRQEQWSVFVSNRVKEIRQLTDPENWFHISGELNPADLPSRGCGVKQLLKSQWWLGPKWLKNPKEQWPKSVVNVNEDEVEKEKRKTVVSACNVEFKTIVSELADRISKFSKIVKVIAWIMRFHPKARDLRRHTELTKEEILNAQKILFRSVQTEYFSNENGRKSLANFQAFKDEDGLLRLKSRLTNEDEPYDFIAPVILPSKHAVVKRIIEQEHILNKHAGTSILLTILRERFWILKGKRTIRSIINDCIICKKQKVKHIEVPFPPLPTDRTKVAAVFQVSGVDLAGPLLTKSGEKVWIVLFSCAVFRAVHLELIPSLSTNAMIQALRRFIARRGRISVLYSDNGTNFTGLNKALKDLDWALIQRTFEVHEIRWKFNPPSAPWWGGFWERLIGILKDLLRKNLGHSSLTYEELLTLVCECESVMNNRPLSYISEESDLRALTPASFLQDIRTSEVPDLDQIERTNILKRWRHIQRVRDNLKHRFKKEYLGFLRSSISKKHDNIKVGDVVLIGRDDKKRLFWPLAKVIELLPGKDGVVRLVKLKTAKGTFLRPVQRLYPLEITQEDCEPLLFDPAPITADTIDEQSKDSKPIEKIDTQTRSGRRVNPPKRLDL